MYSVRLQNMNNALHFTRFITEQFGQTEAKRRIGKMAAAYSTGADSSFPACFVRGGTSNGLMIRREHLPPDIKDWQPILASAMGSPDHYGRQLNGMGSGISSTSKICVVEKSKRPDIDVDYTFVQVGIKDGSLDTAGNCGNMTSAVGPYALNEQISPSCNMGDEEGGISKATMRLFNVNTSKVIHSTFPVTKSPSIQFVPHGNYSIDGVPGRASHIVLSFVDPEGARTGKALPTSNVVDTLELPDGTTMQATLTDIANPGVFVLASDLGIDGAIPPAALEANATLMARLEAIRQAGASLMGLDPNTQSVPKIVILSKPSETLASEGVNIVCRALSMQQAHKAAPLTLALNLGASCSISGTLMAKTAVGLEAGKENSSVLIAHASGKLEVGSVRKNGKIESALLHRTARIMMKGDVFY